MSKQTNSSTEQSRSVPPLRFPEFTGEWEKKKLGEVAEKINSGKTPLGGESVYTERGILFIRSQNVNNDKLSFENSTYIPEEINNTMKNSVVKANDILLNITGASLGRSCVVPNDFSIGNVNQHVCIIRLDKESNPRFVQPILSSTKGRNIFISLQTGSGREGLNFESIKGIEITFPTLPEQTKIATFLTAVDEKIQALKKKHSLLEQYKKGVMQRLFCLHHDSLDLHDEHDFDKKNQQKKSRQSDKSSESRFRPLRFKDENGNEFPDWEVKKLGEIATITTGSSNREDSILDGEYTFFDRSQDIRTSNRFLFDKEAVIVPGEGQEFTPKYFVGKFDLHQRTYAIFDFDNINGKFLFYSIIYNDKHLQSQAVGSTVKSLRLPMFETMPINLPCLKEQTRIANFLSAIDEKINHTAMQIQKTEVWKKGLLQKMFV